VGGYFLRATIRDVAKLANVSTATVSNVITESKFVSDELRAKILESMRILGYEPNIVARSLKINKTFRIGVIVPDITNPFFSEIVKQIETTIDAAKYQLILCNSDYQVETEVKIYNSFIMGGGVDALILVAPRMTEQQLDGDSRLPTVVVDRPAFKTSKEIVFVYTDNYVGASMMASHLLSKDYLRFACIAGPESVPNANMRFTGFRDRLMQAGVEKDDIKVIRCEFSFDEGYKAMTEILEDFNLTERTAVFVSSDIAAWGAIEAAHAKGLEVPKDIGVAGYDNIYFANFINQGLTTIENPTKLMGEQAGHAILDLLNGKGAVPGHAIILDSSLIVRKTV
jgi:LacI family transcriptional regulator